MKLSIKIRQIRESKGLSQDKLATILGLKKPYAVSKLENHQDDMLLSTAYRYAKALSVKVDDLFYVVEE